MPRASGLRHASLLAAVVALSCGTDTIELLPAGMGGGASGGPGGASVSGAESTNGGSASGAGASSGGAGGSAAGASGSFPGGGGSGCNGFGCGGFASGAGAGGDANDCSDNHVFCPCGPQGRCSFGTKCNARIGLCMPKCDSPLECGGEALLCEEHSCAPCSEDEQCEQYATFDRRVCVEGRCEQCEGPSDCPAESPLCVGRRCLQCLDDDDCPDHAVCDKARGRCQK